MIIDEVSVFIKSYLEKNAMVKHPLHRKDSSSDSTESIQTTPDSEYLSNVDDYQFRGMCVYDSVKPTVTQSYFKLKINEIPKF